MLKMSMVGPREVAKLTIREHPSLKLRNNNDRFLGGTRVGDPGAPTINITNADGEPPGGDGAEDSDAPTINAKKHRRRALGRC
jgi:hypothetical protein